MPCNFWSTLLPAHGEGRGSRSIGRPDRGDRAKVKAGRKAARRAR